jgi:Mn-dependent DtxR family transcriptional regulator
MQTAVLLKNMADTVVENLYQEGIIDRTERGSTQETNNGKRRIKEIFVQDNKNCSPWL